MGHLSIVFGCIVSGDEAGFLLEMHERNLATIAALPTTSRDDTYPPLTRDMFSVPPETPGVQRRSYDIWRILQPR
jgi:hypothetical protein